MCNGWKNRETWLVQIWFGDNFAMDADDGVEITADYIREAVEEYVDAIAPASSFIADMMDMRAIDYAELAAAYVSIDSECDGMGHDLNGYGVL
jgi:hypothetical protein